MSGAVAVFRASARPTRNQLREIAARGVMRVPLLAERHRNPVANEPPPRGHQILRSSAPRNPSSQDCRRPTEFRSAHIAAFALVSWNGLKKGIRVDATTPRFEGDSFGLGTGTAADEAYQESSRAVNVSQATAACS